MTSFFSERSIRQKLFMIIVLISGAAVLTASAIFSINDRLFHRQALSYVVNSQAQIVAQNSAAALAFLDKQAAKEVLNGMGFLEHIVQVGIYDDDEQLFAEPSSNPAASIKLPDVLSEVRTNSSEGYLELFEPILVDGEAIGTLYVQADIDRFGITFGSYSRIIIFVFLGSLIITWILARRLHRSITDPVGHIADVARKVTKNNNYSVRARKYHQDELGELVDGINSMLEQIQRRDDLLAEHNEELEDRVSSRTQELEKLSEEYRFLAYHDPLTKLPNRTLFIERLNTEIRRARQSDYKLALLFLDLDRFKNINDTLGHAAGDELLVNVAGRIREAVGPNYTVARFGGDEFTILIDRLNDIDPVTDIAQRLVSAVREPMMIKGHRFQVSASLGMSLFPDDGHDAEILMKFADTAMYSAKADGRNTFSYYTASMHSAATLQMKMEQNMLKALRDKEFSLEFQPIFDSQSGEMVLIEALLRWHNQELGNLMPNDFIPVAEETGFIIELGDWVLRQACMQLMQWKEIGLQNVSMSVNLSSRQLKSDKLEERICQIMREFRLQGEELVIELTESALLSAPEQAKEALSRLREQGIRVSLDDFGTGYSSLSYLKQLPLDALKIDRTFVKGLESSSADSAIVSAIVQLGHGLGLDVVAEGVETAGVMDILKNIQCNQLQGFYFAKPLGVEAFKSQYLETAN